MKVFGIFVFSPLQIVSAVSESCLTRSKLLCVMPEDANANGWTQHISVTYFLDQTSQSELCAFMVPDFNHFL